MEWRAVVSASCLRSAPASVALCTTIGFHSKVGKHVLKTPLVISPVSLVPQILGHERVFLNTRIMSRGKQCSSMVKVRSFFKIHAAVDDGSSQPFSVEGEQTAKDLTPGNGGLLQWLRSAVAKRSAQKEELTNNLKRFGVAGILSYGLLNTIYYLVTFLFVWFYVAPSPGGLGFIPAAQRFLRVFATVWAGSQVTKIFRAAGAISLASPVDRGLNWCTQRFNFKSRGTAFSFLVGVCFGLAALVFLVITILWS